MVSPLAYFCSYINSFLEICRRIVRHVDVNLLTMSKGNSIMALSCAFKASKYISTYVGRIEISCWLFYTFEKYTYKTLILLKKGDISGQGRRKQVKVGGGGGGTGFQGHFFIQKGHPQVNATYATVSGSIFETITCIIRKLIKKTT